MPKKEFRCVNFDYKYLGLFVRSDTTVSSVTEFKICRILDRGQFKNPLFLIQKRGDTDKSWVCLASLYNEVYAIEDASGNNLNISVF